MSCTDTYGNNNLQCEIVDQKLRIGITSLTTNTDHTVTFTLTSHEYSVTWTSTINVYALITPSDDWPDDGLCYYFADGGHVCKSQYYFHKTEEDYGGYFFIDNIRQTIDSSTLSNNQDLECESINFSIYD